MKPRLATFFTGGTISMRIDPATGGAIPMLSGEEIIAQVPGLGDIADYDLINFDRLPGPHWTVQRMLELAAALREKLRAMTALLARSSRTARTRWKKRRIFSTLVLDTEKPVVLIGAMRNSSELSWDGPENLAAAVRVAIDPQSRGLGVVVAMNSQIISAQEATKTHTESTDTFQSRDFGPLGFVDKDRVIVMRRPFDREHILTEQGRSSHVDVIKMFIGADGRFINFAIDDGARGLVIEGLGRGNVTVAAVPAIQRAIDAGIASGDHIALSARAGAGHLRLRRRGPNNSGEWA